ncbi:hypothetical protein Patl1_15799 [Pistacia atlantica]|uniref:Uncharacterized protein n=1 Tax=Pistacia atlantica TaxID=434234 RepID=A0ACC1BBE8_9ROSI|nr:hypothetical protein Patl1_15799 [Pistacia atlantica]
MAGANFEIALWLILCWKPIHVVIILSKMFFAGVSLFAALGFLLYGGSVPLPKVVILKNSHFGVDELWRLFLMLQRFPVESKGRRKKLQEVGYVTTICFTCFLVRCVMMCLNAFDKAANLDVLDHPVLNFIYYLVSSVSGNITFFIGAFHPEEVASKTWYYTISSYTLKRLEMEIWLKEKGINACFSFGDALFTLQ